MSESNEFIRRLGNEELELKLIDEEILGASLAIIAYIILIISANEDKEIILNRRQGIESIDEAHPDRLIALSSIIILIAYIILGNVANVRYEESNTLYENGELNISPHPLLLLSNGYFIAIIGMLLKAIGASEQVILQQQAGTSNEPAEI